MIGYSDLFQPLFRGGANVILYRAFAVRIISMRMIIAPVCHFTLLFVSCFTEYIIVFRLFISRRSIETPLNPYITERTPLRKRSRSREIPPREKREQAYTNYPKHSPAQALRLMRGCFFHFVGLYPTPHSSCLRYRFGNPPFLKGKGSKR